MRFSRDARGHCLLLSQPERELTVEEIQCKLLAVSKCWPPQPPHTWAEVHTTQCGPAWLLFPGYPPIGQVLLCRHSHHPLHR